MNKTDVKGGANGRATNSDIEVTKSTLSSPPEVDSDRALARQRLDDQMNQMANDDTLKQELSKTVDLAREFGLTWVLFIFEEIPSLIRIIVNFPIHLWNSMVRLSLVMSRILIRAFSKPKT